MVVSILYLSFKMKIYWRRPLARIREQKAGTTSICRSKGSSTGDPGKVTRELAHWAG